MTRSMISATLAASGCAALLTLAPDRIAAQQSRGQITFVNHTSFSVNAEVDERPVCPSAIMKNLTCTTQQAPGAHTAAVKGPRGWKRDRRIDVPAGGNCTWTVGEENDDVDCTK